MSDLSRRVTKLEDTRGLRPQWHIVDQFREGPAVEAELAKKEITAKRSDDIWVATALALSGIVAGPMDQIIVVRDLIADSHEAHDREIEQETGPKRRERLIEQRDRFARQVAAIEEAQNR